MLHTVFYAIIFLLALVFSNVINKVFPKIPLPLIQVVIGLILGFSGADKVLVVQPEIFLAFIIAPLLFRESEEAEVRQTLKYTGFILVLIFPLVILTAVGLGIVTHWLYLGAIPLAAAIALGGALAPTDAVVVSALSEHLVFPKRVTSVLKAEGMLNDASGIIVFQIALAALATGTFSPFQASINLLYAAIGGALVGFVLAWLNSLFLTILEDVAAQDTVGYLILELTIPLAAFLIADELGMSGIIAVVAAGVMQAGGLKKMTLFDAQVMKVKTTVWDTLSFVLNSVVFIFLGIELYQLILPLLERTSFSNLRLLTVSLILTGVLFAIRLLVLLICYSIKALRKKRPLTSFWKDSLLMTFSGAKGTIGIAAILLLPHTGFSSDTRALLVFFCAAVTGLTFLVGLFVVPFFTTKKTEKINNVTKIAILTEVVSELEKDMKEAKHKIGYAVAIDSYQDRIQKLIIEQEAASVSTDFNDLQLLILRLETQGLEDALRKNEISMATYHTYQRYLHSLETTVVHHLVSSVQFIFAVIWRAFHLLLTNILHINLSGRTSKKAPNETYNQLTELYFKNTELILQVLENLEGVYDEQLIDFLQAERLRTAAFVAEGGHITRLIHQAHPSNLTEMMRSYYLERKVIFEYESRGELTASKAQELRKNVNALEDYALAGEKQSLLGDFFSFRNRE